MRSTPRKSEHTSRSTLSRKYALVRFPNGETRRMNAGPATDISKAVIEVFAPTFLGKPSVMFCRQSRNEAVAKGTELIRAMGLTPAADEDLPEIVLFDVAPADPLLVFVEVARSDGVIDETRTTALLQIAEQAGFASPNIALVAAVLDREAKNSGEAAGRLAGGSYTWFASEPDNLMAMRPVRG